MLRPTAVRAEAICAYQYVSLQTDIRLYGLTGRIYVRMNCMILESWCYRTGGKQNGRGGTAWSILRYGK